MSFERPEIIRPPSERTSYFLPMTSGCSNATCIFCNYYGLRLQVRELDEVKREIDAVAHYLKSRIRMPGIPEVVYEITRQWDGKGVFLQDADALVYPLPKLQQALEYLNQRLPSVERIATYGTAQDILRRSPSEMVDLRKLRLGIIYLGLESGDGEVLKRIAKGVDLQGMIEAARKAKAADILTSVTVILGLGGVEGTERHAFETAKVLSEMDPDYVGALTLTFVPGTPIYHDWNEGKFTPVSAFLSLRELMTIIENSDFTKCFFSSVHASNYFAIRGTLPQDKERMLSELRYVVQKEDPSSLRPEFLRGL